MRLQKVAYFAATAALCAGASFAQERADRFNQRDANGDGVLSQQEYTSTGGHPGNFRALDLNGDGLLSRGEFVSREGVIEDQAYEGAKADRVYRNPDQRYPSNPNVLVKNEFRKIDVNRDNLLTRREWIGDQATFRRLDINNDGFVSSAEYGGEAPLLGAIGGATVGDAFQRKDLNRDGMLSRTEYGQARTFNRVDRNRDGRISYDEYLNPPPAR
jgi:EF hand